MELTNDKFSIEKIRSIAINDNTTYDNYYSQLKNISGCSYFKILLPCIKTYINNQKLLISDQDLSENIIDIDEDFWHNINLLFMPLFNYKIHLENLFEKLIKIRKKDLKTLFEEDYKIFNKRINIPTSKFDSSSHNNSSIFINKKNSAQIIHCFSNIVELGTYELYMFLNTDFKIIKCKECPNFTFVKHKNREFCSEKCKKDYEKNNAFYRKYRNLYKNYSHQYYEPYISLFDFDIRGELKKIYDEYEIYYKSDNETAKLAEYDLKLEELKNKIKKAAKQ